jgi:CBS domain-containing protein
MRIGAICTRLPETTTRLITVRHAAEQMALRDVGALIVTDAEGRAEGILTDRDVVIRCVAEGRSPEETAVEEVMSSSVTTAHEDTTVEIGLEMMANAEVRRLVVLNDAGRVVGIITLDDMLGGIIEQSDDVGRLLHGQVRI